MAELTDPPFNGHLGALIAAMFVASIVSGSTRYFAQPQDAGERKSHWFSNVLLSAVACFVVPLFLQTISSDLLSGDSIPTNKYLVFFGLCLTAGYFAPDFMLRMYSQLVSKLDRTAAKAESADKKAEQAKNIAELGINKKMVEPRDPEEEETGPDDEEVEPSDEKKEEDKE